MSNIDRQNLMADWFPSNLSNIGSYASFFGFLFGIWIFIRTYLIEQKVEDFKKLYLFDKRYKSHIEHLSGFLKRINDELNISNPNYFLIKNIFVESVSELDSIQKKLLDKNVILRIGRLGKSIKRIRRSKIDGVRESSNPILDDLFWHYFYNRPSKECFHYIRDELNAVRSTLDHLYQDSKRSFK